mgnify:CR=1 FL=1
MHLRLQSLVIPSLKYNGEELKKHIVSVEVLVQNVLRDTWNSKDLNPDYKEEGDENYEG